MDVDKLPNSQYGCRSLLAVTARLKNKVGVILPRNSGKVQSLTLKGHKLNAESSSHLKFKEKKVKEGLARVNRRGGRKLAKAYRRQPHLKSCTKSYGIIHATADLQAGSLSIPLYLMTRKELRKYGSSGIGFARSSIYMIGGEVKGRELPWMKFEHSKFNRYVIAPFERSKGSKFIMVSDIKVDRIYFK